MLVKAVALPAGPGLHDALPLGTVYGTLLNHRAALAALGDAVHRPPYKAPPQAPGAVKPGVDAAFGEAGMAPPQPDALDAVIDTEMAEWQALLEPVVAPLQAAIDEAVAKGESAAQLLERLPTLLESMSPEALTAALTRAAFTARLGGVAGLAAADDGAGQ